MAIRIGNPTQRGPVLSIDGSVVTVIVLAFLILFATAAVVIPWTEAAREAAREEQFQQRIANLVDQESARLSLTSDEFQAR